MKLHNVSIAIIVASIVVLGLTSYFGSLAEGYGASFSLDGMNKTSERLTNLNNNNTATSDQLANVLLDEEGSAVYEIPYVLIVAGYRTVKQIVGGWITVGIMAVEMEGGLQESGISLPSWLVPSIISIMLVSLFAILIYAYFKWKFET